jgi:transposase
MINLPSRWLGIKTRSWFTNSDAGGTPRQAQALVAIARSILIIIWHLLADPTKRFTDLGPDHYITRIEKGRKIRNLVRQLEALGQSVTLQPAA